MSELRPHINHLGISGGKDSTAALLWMVHESGYDPATLDVSFCDTGNEFQETYDYIAMLSDRVHPIHTIEPERDFFELARHKKRFPSAMARFCTQMLKMEPTREYLYGYLDLGCTILLHTGVRASESPARAMLPEREMDSYYALPVYRPLLRWSIDDVWTIHAKYGIPRNPLYAMGMQRVGCAPCVMSRKAEIRRIAELFPERIDRIREEEASVRNGCGYSSMFASDTTPAHFRSRPITTKDGRHMNVCTIDDVVRWAKSVTGDLDLEFADEAPTCSHTSGACE